MCGRQVSSVYLKSAIIKADRQFSEYFTDPILMNGELNWRKTNKQKKAKNKRKIPTPFPVRDQGNINLPVPEGNMSVS